MVELTGNARAISEQTFSGLLSDLSKHMEHFSDDELRVIGEFLVLSREGVRRHAEDLGRLPAGASQPALFDSSGRPLRSADLSAEA